MPHETEEETCRRVAVAVECACRPAIKTTLVALPVTLLDQWERQMSEHTGGKLRVLKLAEHSGMPAVKPTLPQAPVLESLYTHANAPAHPSAEWNEWYREMREEQMMARREHQALLVEHAVALVEYERQCAACGAVAPVSMLGELSTYDVVLVALPTLLMELKTIKAASCLSRVTFWRLIVDEAHELLPSEEARSRWTSNVQNTIGHVLRRESFYLSRQYTWLVSGTPFRSKFEDLSGMLELLDSAVWSPATVRWISDHYQANSSMGGEALELAHRCCKSVMWRCTTEQTEREAALPPLTSCKVLVPDLAQQRLSHERVGVFASEDFLRAACSWVRGSGDPGVCGFSRRGGR